VYFLPMRQDDPDGKPHSLVAEYSRMSEGLRAALESRQLRPLFM
jgi:dipicolinate synthase subunit B